MSRAPGCARNPYRGMDRGHYVWDNRSDTATLRNHRDRSVDDHSWGHHRHGDHR
ncbi:hypothetical protein H0H10_14335 [Streptomyces sp. TRM S81-3]|uniref:Uncharacterized protein n=1 Tax=Streptomyces griseicoloratus TaxID=2752516 RepID=A0A926QRV3_9ACTN|nr:hypothetical protein [Streptomyces griseicoloratus]MBD0420307.1 hypothetical protein [Streptomyces griseicoloratus]